MTRRRRRVLLAALWVIRECVKTYLRLMVIAVAFVVAGGQVTISLPIRHG